MTQPKPEPRPSCQDPSKPITNLQFPTPYSWIVAQCKAINNTWHFFVYFFFMYGSSFNFDQLFLRVWAHCGNLQLFLWFKDSRLDASSKFFQVICIALSNLNMALIAKWKWVLANIFISFPTFSGSNKNHTGHLQREISLLSTQFFLHT